MFLFKRNKSRNKQEGDQEKKIQAIHNATLKKLDETTDRLHELNAALDDPTLNIFLATGGDKRK